MGHGGNGNLTVPEAGEIRNPNGRGKGTKNRSTVLRELAALKLSSQPLLKNYIAEFQLPEGATLEQAAAASLLIQVLKGDVSAIKEFSDTLHGKITEKIENAHSFTQMGQIKMTQGEAGNPATETALSFNVGSEPATDTGDDDEND